MTSYLDLLAERVVIFDGATGTNIQALGLGPDDFGGASFEGCNEILVSTRPDVITELHSSFLSVGVDVVETNSFGDLPFVLGEYGIADSAEQMAKRAGELAKDAAQSYSTPDHPRFCAGSIGPGTKSPTLSQISFAELRDAYEVVANGLLAGGIDLFVIETTFDVLGAKAAMIGCRKAMARIGRQVPIQVQVTIELSGRMLLGTEVGAALNALEAMRPDVIGINCATGPGEMYEAVRYLCANSVAPVVTMPNAGLPSVVDGKMHYDLGPEQLAEHLYRFASEYGVSVIGGCCGTSPAHLAQVVKRCGNLEVIKRKVTRQPGASSLYSFVPFDQDQSVLMVGERSNANGSKRFREAMLAKDYDTTTAMARNQVKEGAHLIDVCVDYTGADGVADMTEVMSRIATQVTTPIMIDSTEPAVIEAALEHLGGRSVLNSVNLEDGDAPGTRLDRFLSLAAEHGAAVVCTCIDTEGQARTAKWKLRAAKAIYDIAVDRYGLQPSDLFFDPLALPLSTGLEESRRDGIETIEGIRAIKAALPGVHTILGLSNVSFGLNPASRQALNSVFLHECTQAGLDSAIVHGAKILPLHKIDEKARQACLDLIWDRRRDEYDPLTELIAIFDAISGPSAPIEDRSTWSVEARLSQRIIDGDRNGLGDDLDEALTNGLSALRIVNDILLAGMKVVGDLFGSGEMQLPFVLQSAETMKAAVAHLEPHMERADIGGRGTVVLATVKGDVHDIGKNLVDIIFTNNGYEVHNLGIKVAISDMLTKAEEVSADAIGMSGLLVKSTLVMRENLEEMNRKGLHGFPVLLGGAALTRTYVEKDLREVFNGRVFYGRDAFEGLSTMERIMELKRSGEDDPSFGTELSGRKLPPRRSQLAAQVDPATIPARSPSVGFDYELFDPPFLGSRIAKGIALDEVLGYLNETALFRNQWGYRPENGENDADFKDRVRVELRRRIDEAKATDVLVPQVAWGYFPAASHGNDLIIYDEANDQQEIERFTFPRQTKDPYLCIADFFPPEQAPARGHVGFVIATMGATASERSRELFEANRYLDYVSLHGLSVEMTEALMEYWHHRMRTEWGYVDQDGPSLQGLFRQQYRGGRYSFGYPACPNLEDNGKVLDLLDAKRIGVTMSDGIELEPEQTTLAIVCHHPLAKYFVA